MTRVFSHRGKTIIVPSVAWTKDNENQAVIDDKAATFHAVWDRLKAGKKIKKPKDTRKKAWRSIKKLVKDRKRMAWFNRMEASGCSITNSTEDDMREFLKEYIAQSKVRKVATVKKISSQIRSALRAIGRERHVSTADPYVKFRGRTYLHTGNPMTESLEAEFVEELIDEFENSQQRRSRDAVATAAVVDPHGRGRLGMPVSVVTFYVLILNFLAEAMTKYERLQRGSLNDYRQVENLFTLVLMYALCMHEGTRPGDVQYVFEHGDIGVIADAYVHALTLVFVQPATYTYLMTNNLLAKLKVGCFKGKDKRIILERVKSVMPCAYNSLDLVHIYVICTRAIASMLGASFFDDKLVMKNVNISSLRARKCKHLGFTDATHYSGRYAGAEEDEKAQIPEEWTRKRMGHTSISDTKDEYAANRGNRASLNGTPLPLGMDHITTEACTTIPLHFSPIDRGGLVFAARWKDEVFSAAHDGYEEGFRVDFEHTADLVKAWLVDDDDDAKKALSAMAEGMDRKWYKTIPLGTHIKLPEALCPRDLRDMYDASVKTLSTYFAKVDEPELIPELYAFPQVYYGDWRKLIGKDTDADVYIEKPTDGDSGTNNINARQRRQKRASKSARSPAVPTPQAASDTQEEEHVEADEPERLFKYDYMEVGSIAAVICRKPDKAAMPIAMNDEGDFRHIWLVKVTKHTEHVDGSYTIKGWFMYNEKPKDIIGSYTKRVRDVITCHSVHDVVGVYDAEDPFLLDENNVNELRIAIMNASAGDV